MGTTPDPRIGAELAALLERAIPPVVTVDNAAQALAEAPADSMVIIVDPDQPTIDMDLHSEDLRDISPLRATGVAIRLGRSDLTSGGPRDRRARQLGKKAL